MFILKIEQNLCYSHFQFRNWEKSFWMKNLHLIKSIFPQRGFPSLQFPCITLQDYRWWKSGSSTREIVRKAFQGLAHRRSWHGKMVYSRGRLPLGFQHPPAVGPAMENRGQK